MRPKHLLAIASGREIVFYKSKEWRVKREEVLQRDNYECQRCKRDGRFSPADCVHHIIHLKDDPMLGLEEANLESLCDSCHNLVHPEKFFEKKVKFINEERWE
ncbi:HNH endonuclease [Fusibacter sp. JL298sf-3]